VSLARRPWFVLLLFGSLILASRVPLAPGQLFTFDDVNLAYSVQHFDIRASQPHPPGYPLFVLEMRALWWLHFRHVRVILFALAVGGSIAAVFLLALCGNRMLGGHSGFYAAWLLVLNPVFWHAGLVSALRVQLAVISIAVAACCWQAWLGRGRWVLWSAIALALGAGIRPETGVLLFPLWAACALRAPVSWRERGIALAAMTGAVLVWLLPAMLASGGPTAFVRACLDYVADQASVSSGLFGADDRRWQTTFWRTIVWTFCSALGWSLPAVLAWRRREGWGAGRDRLAFLAIWFLPAFAFGLLVHIEDPGHALLMVPVVVLFGGYLFNRALDNLGFAVSRAHAVVLALAALAVAWILDRHNAEFAVVWIPVACLAAGLLLKLAPIKNFGHLPRLHAALFLLTPVILLNWVLFHHQGWYYRGGSTSGWRAAAERITADLTSGVALTSYEQIHNTLAVDDHSVRAVMRLAAARPGRTRVLWERGLTAWRKICYYSPALPVAVLEHKQIRAGSPPVVALWRGERLEGRTQGSAPQRVSLPAGSRIVWVLNPATEFYQAVSQAFPLTAEGPVWYSDLPDGHGSRTVGDYEVTW
jgi:hypothetical protein